MASFVLWFCASSTWPSHLWWEVFLDFSPPTSQTHSPYSTLLTLALGWGCSLVPLTKLPEEPPLQDSKEESSGNAWGYISLNILPSPDWYPPAPPNPTPPHPPLSTVRERLEGRAGKRLLISVGRALRKELMMQSTYRMLGAPCVSSPKSHSTPG